MRPVTLLMFAAIFALAGAAALAETCPAPAAACPSPCPAPLTCPPAPCPGECAAIPAAVGAGPVPSFCELTCETGFDAAFVRAMYQQHANIISLATLAIQQSTDASLRDLSGKIRYERTKMNEKLVKHGRNLGICDLDVTCDPCLTGQLNTLVGQDFNIKYAVLMIGMLQQSMDAAKIGMERASIADLRNTEKIEYRASQNEVMALQNWLARQGVSCQVEAAPCPAPAAGPVCPAPTPVCPSPCPPASTPVCPSACP